MENETEEFEALDFVYCGRLWTSGGVYVTLRPIKGGKLQEEMAFKFDRKAVRTVGGVYRGAQFRKDGAKMIGLKERHTFIKQWEDRAALIDWAARDTLADFESKAKKSEADANRADEIEKIMLPLRVQYEKYRLRRDYGGMKALEVAVVASLLSSPRKIEEQ